VLKDQQRSATPQAGDWSTDGHMDVREGATLSFIIRIWIEETSTETGNVRWRGHITHVPSGKRRYLQDLPEIIAFIAPYVGTIERAPTDGDS
jgi:hypothetical protein